jgi:hypothetical protein
MKMCESSLNLRLYLGTLFPDVEREIPTVVDNLHSQGKIPSRLLGVYLEPYDPTNDKTSMITYGLSDGLL